MNLPLHPIAWRAKVYALRTRIDGAYASLPWTSAANVEIWKRHQYKNLSNAPDTVLKGPPNALSKPPIRNKSNSLQSRRPSITISVWTVTSTLMPKRV
jgi:hypothetical protein